MNKNKNDPELDFLEFTVFYFSVSFFHKVKSFGFPTLNKNLVCKIRPSTEEKGSTKNTSKRYLFQFKPFLLVFTRL